jgi:hypothetical protein
VPELLSGYANNLKEHDHYEVGFVVVGDNRTPNNATRQLVERITNQCLEAEYWDVLSQKKWLKRFPGLDGIVPYNSDNRRNLGYLIAAEEGADLIISIDDDNFVGSEDYFGQHSIVGKTQKLNTACSANGWFNPCSMLQINPPRTIYPRGFPYSKRWKDKITWKHDSGRIMLNLGLWKCDPDVDAVTNLNEPVTVVGIRSEQVMLAPETYSPINTQNTAFHRDVLPCFYNVLMGARIQGTVLDRYGDIWSGFFAKKIIDQMDDRVSIGYPLTEHRRNPHDLFKDLQSELWGMILTEHLVPVLESIKLTERTYMDAYLELARELKSVNIFPNKDVEKYFAQLTNAMEVWVETCEKIL